jgi:hypothetical protein
MRRGRSVTRDPDSPCRCVTQVVFSFETTLFLARAEGSITGTVTQGALSTSQFRPQFMNRTIGNLDMFIEMGIPTPHQVILKIWNH